MSVRLKSKPAGESLWGGTLGREASKRLQCCPVLFPADRKTVKREAVVVSVVSTRLGAGGGVLSLLHTEPRLWSCWSYWSCTAAFWERLMHLTTDTAHCMASS